MTQVVKLREKLVNKLSDLFQLNQPDLDFGFYRIMHAKAAQVQQFIDQDLLTIISDAFGQADDNQVATARGKYEAAIQQAKDFGAPNPEETKPVQEAKAAYDAARESSSNEAQVYDHLYRFFERYYDDGDFISRRYYTRETASNAAPYAIPYNGEEVKLHWANADQYYIKSAEYFSNFSFDLRQAKEVQAQEGLDFGHSTESCKVHFQIVDASEGEHGNIKAADNAKREFFLHQANPVALNESSELVVNFEYRVRTSADDLSKSAENLVRGQFDAKGANKGDLPNLVLTSQILSAARKLDKLHPDFIALLNTPAPTDKVKQRPLLTKYINQYTSRNTMDYFIHKDLGSFLRRELDFYIKNEVMRLDDIENADAPAVESYLSKIKVLRQIAHKLIDFLAQLEDFQKKLWLKKKFVTETNYCVTLDRVPVELYPEICTNQAQLEEWIQLFAIDEIKGDLTTPAFSNPLTVEFLQANQNLVLDTQFFSEQFKAELIASIEDLDEQCDGVLVHSENFQALNLLSKRYQEQVKCVYIDPPYNTGDDGFIYKDTYKHSSWLTLLNDRLDYVKEILKQNGWLFINIDEREHHRLIAVLEEKFSSDAITTITVKMSHLSGMKMSHLDRKPPKIKEYLVMVAANTIYSRMKPQYEPASWFEAYERYTGYLLKDENNPEDLSLWKRVNFKTKAREEGVDVDNEERLAEWALKNAHSIFRTAVNDSADFKKHPKDREFRKILTPTGLIKYSYNQEEVLFASSYLKEIDGLLQPAKIQGDIWTDIGINNLHNEGGVQFQNGKKPIKLIERAIRMSQSENDYIFDFFSGSGSTAHAVVSNNIGSDANNKFVCIEQGSHFDSVLKERIKKIMYSRDWLLAKATSDTGYSLFIKYNRLESYEDTLNNLRLVSDSIRKRVVEGNKQLKQDYMLNYMLDVEARGSQSLLNIDAFADPTAYTLEVKKPGGDESVERTIDLIETFNYLIGLRVDYTAAPQSFDAKFNRVQDAHAPQGQTTRLVLDGRLQQDDKGPWWLRKIEGWLPADPANPNNGARDKVLIVWRKLTGDLEQDNLVLDEWFKAHRINSRDFEYATIYVNGSNNLPNLKKAEDRWKVRLIEEEFMQRMWDVEG